MSKLGTVRHIVVAFWEIPVVAAVVVVVVLGIWAAW